jgi:hypothetical protein
MNRTVDLPRWARGLATIAAGLTLAGALAGCPKNEYADKPLEPEGKPNSRIPVAAPGGAGPGTQTAQPGLAPVSR